MLTTPRMWSTVRMFCVLDPTQLTGFQVYTSWNHREFNHHYPQLSVKRSPLKSRFSQGLNTRPYNLTQSVTRSVTPILYSVYLVRVTEYGH